MKGLVIQLSPDAAQSLRQGSLPRDGDDDDDWNDVIPLGRQSATTPQSAVPATTANVEGGAQHDDNAAEEEEIANADDENDIDDDDESFMSRTPPHCLPTLRVDLERLVGYVPQTPEEVARLSDEVSEALGTAGDAAFEARVAEMLDANLARHATTRIEDKDPSSSSPPESSSLRYVNLPYPPAMILEDGRHTVVTTARLWKRVIKPYRGGGADAVVNRLLDRLAHCSRPLTWKASMRREVLALARREEMRLEMAEHEFHRSDQLRKLYGVRETIENQVNVTSVRVEELERERDELVRQRLALRRLERGSEYKSEAMNLGFDIFSRGDEGDDVEDDVVPLSTDYSCDEESEDSDDNDSDSGESTDANIVSDDDGSELEESPSRESTMESTQASSASENVNHGVGRRRRRRRSGQPSREARRQREQQEKTNAEAAEAARVRREKEAMQQQCTTPELASLQAVLQALERKLHQVDELLETLQEEEWKKEEELGDSDDDDVESDDEGGDSDPLQQQKQLSLLDEILAMVLGATRPPLDNPSMDDHVAWMRNEHREIVKGWKDHFGRVPPPLLRDDPQGPVSSHGVDSSAAMDSTTFESTGRLNLDRSAVPNVNEQNDDPILKDRLKLAFGIEDNDVENWEEGEGDESPAREETVKALRPQRGRRSRR